jgi:hypothetical protein
MRTTTRNQFKKQDRIAGALLGLVLFGLVFGALTVILGA